MERTLIMVKPDAMKRGLAGKVIERFERKGLEIIAAKMVELSEQQLKEHYAHHRSKPFFKELLEYMSKLPVIMLVFEGRKAVEAARKVAGATDGLNAEPGTVRGDFSLSTQCNLVHASESAEVAEKEIGMFFSKEEIFSKQRENEWWKYTEKERGE